MIHDVDVAEVLRNEGYRVTTARRVVWDVLHTGRHLSVDEIYQEVHRRAPEVNLASVYRTLALLHDLDLVHEVQVDGRGRWELTHAEEEIHLVCRRCDSVSHHPAELAEEVLSHLAEGHGFTSETLQVVVYGVCGDCA